jgi:hypothetical protein
MKNQTPYFGLPINIQDILTARTVEWERLKTRQTKRCRPTLPADERWPSAIKTKTKAE